jgi:hypothetical protein
MLVLISRSQAIDYDQYDKYGEWDQQADYDYMRNRPDPLVGNYCCKRDIISTKWL